MYILCESLPLEPDADCIVLMVPGGQRLGFCTPLCCPPLLPVLPLLVAGGADDRIELDMYICSKGGMADYKRRERISPIFPYRNE